jgi:hypothetical protein
MLMVLALALSLAACTNTASSSPTTTTVGLTTKTLPFVDVSSVPAGWVPVAFGDTQLSVPASFWVLDPGQNSCEAFPSSGALFLAPSSSKIACPGLERARATFVRLVPHTGIPAKGPGEKLIVVNGLPVYYVPPSKARPYLSYFAPYLGVLVTGSGPLARQVLDTLTCSPRDVVLASGRVPAIPWSWRPVTVAGLRFSVPRSWPVEQTKLWNLCGPVQIVVTQDVFLDTDQEFQPLPCPLRLPYAIRPSDGVRVDTGSSPSLSELTGSFSPGLTCLHLGGITACPSRTPGYSVLLFRVTVPGGMRPLLVSIGLAGNGMVARRILYSLRAA